METGRKRAMGVVKNSNWKIDKRRKIRSPFKLSGNSVLPAYPGFIVMKAAQDCTSFISRPSKTKRFDFIALAFRIVISCCAMTERTSMSIRLNSDEEKRKILIVNLENC